MGLPFEKNALGTEIVVEGRRVRREAGLFNSTWYKACGEPGEDAMMAMLVEDVTARALSTMPVSAATGALRNSYLKVVRSMMTRRSVALYVHAATMVLESRSPYVELTSTRISQDGWRPTQEARNGPKYIPAKPPFWSSELTSLQSTQGNRCRIRIGTCLMPSPKLPVTALI